MDSIYVQCANAARALMATQMPFTANDVVLAAASEWDEDGSDDWGEGEFAEAEKHAPQVLYALYRSLRLVRFGVVPESAPLTGEPDYVRREGSMFYADVEGWQNAPLKTPNGAFDTIYFGADPLFKVGRRKASERDDFIPWAEQGISLYEENAMLRKRVAELEAQLAKKLKVAA